MHRQKPPTTLDEAEVVEEASVVVPVDPFQRGELEAAPCCHHGNDLRNLAGPLSRGIGVGAFLDVAGRGFVPSHGAEAGA